MSMCPRIASLSLLVTAALAASCSSTSNGGGGGGGGGDAAMGDRPPASDSGTPAAMATAVTTFQFDRARTGANRNERALTPASVQSGRFSRDAAFAPQLDGEVYAQPLYLGALNIGGTSRAVLFVVTQNNTAYALDARSGEEIWHTTAGSPVPRSAQPCGNVNQTGMLGTPVIDPQAGTLYVVSYVRDGTAVEFRLNALDVTDGRQRAGYPAPLRPAMSNGSTFSPLPTQQRGALAFADGRVYVPFGGLYGDCGIYHGWMVSIDAGNPTRQVALATPGRGSGIWAPAGEALDEMGRIYVATGNSTPLGGHTAGSLGEFVLRLGSGSLGFAMSDEAAQFSPTNARSLDFADLDIGSVAPVLLPPVQGLATRLLIQGGKEGVTYLIDRENLGGVGMGVFSQRLFSSGNFGAAGAWSNGAETYAFVPGRGRASGCSANGGVMALRVTAEGGGRFATAWCSGSISQPSPPAISSNGNNDAVVWVAGSSPATLRAYDLSNGMEIFSDAPPSVRQWTSLVVADGRVYVTGRSSVSLYRLE